MNNVHRISHSRSLQMSSDSAQRCSPEIELKERVAFEAVEGRVIAHPVDKEAIRP